MLAQSPTSAPTTWNAVGRGPNLKQPNPYRSSFATPSSQQRKRILDILTTLTPHHTRECTRHSTLSYKIQAEERCRNLIGNESPPHQRSFFALEDEFHTRRLVVIHSTACDSLLLPWLRVIPVLPKE